jgi:DNA-binding Lrp family transcriptional regulator
VDAIDEKTIAELTRNDRISHSETAGKVLLSRNAVRQRIERLERQGQITGYTIVRAGGDTPAMSPRRWSSSTARDRMRGGDVLAALKRTLEVVLCGTRIPWAAPRPPRPHHRNRPSWLVRRPAGW